MKQRKKKKKKKNTSIPCWVRKNGEQNSKERARATERIGGKIWEWKGACLLKDWSSRKRGEFGQTGSLLLLREECERVVGKPENCAAGRSDW